MTLARQDLLDADNAQRVGCTGANARLFALCVVPGAGLCVYAGGLLEPLDGLTAGDVLAAMERVAAREAEHAAAATTCERLAPDLPSHDDALRMLEVEEFMRKVARR